LRGQWPRVFSFEKDYLEKVVGEKSTSRLFGLVQDNYFIDIGIPEDYLRVQEEFKKSL
jgi:D-glycero-alpha-D-manno-heptose 1-phosphate guanylyltransferase